MSAVLNPTPAAMFARDELGVLNRLKVGYFDVFRLALVSSNS